MSEENSTLDYYGKVLSVVTEDEAPAQTTWSFKAARPLGTHIKQPTIPRTSTASDISELQRRVNQHSLDS